MARSTASFALATSRASAMENASDAARAAARIIAPTNDEAGVAQVLEQYVLT